MDPLTERVRRAALEAGADLVGFAPVERFAGAPAELHPRTIFPQVRSAVAVALRHPRGALKAAEEGTYWQAYNCDAYWFLNEVESVRILRRICLALEEDGWTAVPVHNPFRAHVARKTRDDQPAGPDGMLSLRVLGVAAGLGELGLSKVLLTPRFGPRQRVFGVLTDAPLEPTPLFTGKICDECGACVQECEAGAIAAERDVRFSVDGVAYGHGAFDAAKCSKVHRGDDPRFSPFWTGREAPGEMPEYYKFLDLRFRHRSICVGRGCLRACLDHLEKTGRIEARFRAPLIERPRWKLV
jgi:ferredoxin